MPRMVYKKYYDHDDRASGSNNIRKVSFMQGGGKVKKNSGSELMKQFIDDDVDMGGTHRKGWKRNKSRPRKNFKGRPGSPGLRHPNKNNLPTLKLSDWYQIKILYGKKYEKNTLLQRILSHISPHVFIPNSFSIVGNNAVFYVDDIETANILRNATRQILLEDGHLMSIQVRNCLPPRVNVDDALKEKLKLVMAKRYIAETKALDLSKFASDPDLAGLHCPLSRPIILKVVWQIITDNISDIVAINLSSNKISVLEESSSLEIRKLKALRTVHLGDNFIKSLNALNCFKENELTELVLKNNPLTKNYQDNAYYVRGECAVEWIENKIGLFHSEIRKIFPKLMKLDDMELPPVITFDVAEEETKLPTPQAAFLCNPEGRGIVKEFLSQYFAIYDSDNRLDLIQAYHENSSFSLCAYYPPNQKTNINRLNAYMQESRNLFRIQDYMKRKSKLFLGKLNIVSFLRNLPKSQHDLSSFVVDLSLFSPVLINLSVNGVFREPYNVFDTKSCPVRHFCRTFLIVPVGQGFCIINDMLLVTNATEMEVRCAFTQETNAKILQSPSSISNDASIVKKPDGTVPMDESVQLQMVQTLATKTGMNLAWSKKCLDETQWDFDRAIWTFTELQSKGGIPAEAFIK